MKKLEDLGSRIFECRKSRGMTQEEMAVRLGVTPQALSKWERGQSYPDVVLFSDICEVLGASADWLLGVEQQGITENGDEKAQDEIWENLQSCLEPLELVFGKNLVDFFIDNSFVEKIVEIRKRLSKEGILMPILRIRDNLALRDNEFMILAYNHVLYDEELSDSKALQDQDGTGGENMPLQHILNKLEETVRSRYGEIINSDIVKIMVDNLQHKRPALISGVVPEIISYGMLTDILRGLMKKGVSAAYLEKIIEYSESALRRKQDIGMEQLIEQIAVQTECEDNLSTYLSKRKGS